jgi:hypothetical protein
MSLPKTLGRALGVAGSGSGLTARALGAIVGAETHAITLAELPTGITSTPSSPWTVSVVSGLNVPVTSGNITPSTFSTGTGSIPQSSAFSWGIGSFTTTGTATSNNTSGAATSLMQPEVFLNCMVKQ